MIFRTILFALLLLAPAAIAAGLAHDEPTPYDETRDARTDLKAALARAAEKDTKVLLVMGANWCHDSRAFAADMDSPEFTPLINDHYELVYVDVGQKNRNIDIARDYGFRSIVGTPTVIIMTPDGEVLNRKSAPTWRNAASFDDNESLIYFTEFAAGLREE